jgi:hypothetical protein
MYSQVKTKGHVMMIKMIATSPCLTTVDGVAGFGFSPNVILES